MTGEGPEVPDRPSGPAGPSPRLFDLLVAGGEVVTPGGVVRADVAVLGERIAALLAPGHGAAATRTIDAAGCFVAPGGVDPHVHLGIEFGGQRTAHDVASGTAAAAFGGTTTVIDFAFPVVGGGPEAAVEARLVEAEGRAHVDYGLHVVLADSRPATLAAIPRLVDAGIPTVKLFTTYREHGLYLDDGDVTAILAACADHGALALAHAENDALVARASADLRAAGRTGARFHPLSRPPLAELEAASRLILFARASRAALYLVHVTQAGVVDLVARARADGAPIHAETCPHYLLLDDTLYAGETPERWTMSPPLRTPIDQAALWRGLASGVVTCVGSDDSAWHGSQKAAARDTFWQVPPGIAGVETRLPLLWSEGPARAGLAPAQVVDLVSSNPARLFGLYPRKGALLVGSDADLVVIDPRRELRLEADRLHMPVGYSPFAGWRLLGAPRTTLVRGQVVVHEGELLGRRGHGRFLPRALTPAVLRGPALA